MVQTLLENMRFRCMPVELSQLLLFAEALQAFCMCCLAGYEGMHDPD